MKTTITLGAAIIAGMLVSGCSSKPDPDSFGGRLQNEGGAMAAIGEKWSDGDAMIRDGRDLAEDGEDDIAKGERLIKTGNKKIRNGKAMVADGERLKREAEETYRLRNAVPGAVTAPAS